jgi:hypothetical protein
MTMAERSDARQRAGVRGPARVVRLLFAGVALALAFLLGIAFARALDERPEDGATVTSVRTLSPLPQSGPMRTVTVTVTAP